MLLQLLLEMSAITKSLFFKPSKVFFRISIVTALSTRYAYTPHAFTRFSIDFKNFIKATRKRHYDKTSYGGS